MLFAVLSYVGAAVFFFQAEDGIRDFHVTGVQTCALPICFQRGILFSFEDYLELVDCTGRISRSDKRGAIDEKALPILERLRSEEHTSELQSRENLVCRLLLEKKKGNP